MAAVVALLVVLAVFASSAGAHDTAPMQDVGRATFPQACSPVTLITGAPRNPAHPDWVAWSNLPECSLTLTERVDELDPVSACTIVVHEYGHLAGLGHSDDPASVMYAPTRPFPPCVGRFAQRIGPGQFVAAATDTGQGFASPSLSREVRRPQRMWAVVTTSPAESVEFDYHVSCETRRDFDYQRGGQVIVGSAVIRLPRPLQKPRSCDVDLTADYTDFEAETEQTVTVELRASKRP